MKNSNTISTKQCSILSCIAFLLSCGVIYNVIFITMTLSADPGEKTQKPSSMQLAWDWKHPFTRSAQQQPQGQGQEIEIQPIQQQPMIPIQGHVPMMQPHAMSPQQQQLQQAALAQAVQEQKTIVFNVQAYSTILNSMRAQISDRLKRQSQANANDSNNDRYSKTMLTELPTLLNLYNMQIPMPTQNITLPGANYYLSTTLSSLYQQASLTQKQLPYEFLKNIHYRLNVTATSLANDVSKLLHPANALYAFDQLNSGELQERSTQIEAAYAPTMRSIFGTIQEAQPSFFNHDPAFAALHSLLLHYANTISFCINTLNNIVKMRMHFVAKHQRNPAMRLHNPSFDD